MRLYDYLPTKTFEIALKWLSQHRFISLIYMFLLPFLADFLSYKKTPKKVLLLIPFHNIIIKVSITRNF